MKTRAIALILALLIPVVAFGQIAYLQDFEALDPADLNALANDGWVVYGNVFGPDWSYWYGYGTYPAPNDGAAFCALVTGEGGGAQGAVQLSVYSDYNNANHADGWVQSLVFQERTIEAADVGYTMEYKFQAKLGNLELDSTAFAFIKTLDPNAGWATTNEITLDMTNTPDTWSDYVLTIPVDGTMVGQILQFGFGNMAHLYQGSSIIYDNITFGPEGTIVATDEVTLDAIKSLYR